MLADLSAHIGGKERAIGTGLENTGPEHVLSLTYSTDVFVHQILAEGTLPGPFWLEGGCLFGCRLYVTLGYRLRGVWLADAAWDGGCILCLLF